MSTLRDKIGEKIRPIGRIDHDGAPAIARSLEEKLGGRIAGPQLEHAKQTVVPFGQQGERLPAAGRHPDCDIGEDGALPGLARMGHQLWLAVLAELGQQIRRGLSRPPDQSLEPEQTEVLLADDSPHHDRPEIRLDERDRFADQLRTSRGANDFDLERCDGCTWLLQ